MPHTLVRIYFTEDDEALFVKLLFALKLVIAGAVGSFIGARLTSLWLPSNRVRQLFGVVLVIVTLYKVLSMLSH
ncbi:hypothetical protein [Thermodesulfobacterium sp.]|jgi:uncharacterized membrane protein YfcA|uniref:hypothetical protein n=1 Tax=Thermodesulfobacterium sp. TaxID=1965289 RepID=UPI00048B3E0B|nr:hypothetical protein [Thermodesulfobacterium sp.]MBZ4682541.1 hypothetical protein [Thermodesulfobacterium sp.]MDN5379486.1 hypothetical protein [Thermodesulfobacterium sp.]